jgi:hypothetical protein
VGIEGEELGLELSREVDDGDAAVRVTEKVFGESSGREVCANHLSRIVEGDREDLLLPKNLDWCERTVGVPQECAKAGSQSPGTHRSIDGV